MVICQFKYQFMFETLLGRPDTIGYLGNKCLNNHHLTSMYTYLHMCISHIENNLYIFKLIMKLTLVKRFENVQKIIKTE